MVPFVVYEDPFTEEMANAIQAWIGRKFAIGGSWTIDELLAAARPKMPGGPTKALVSPHAGYIYSGAVAASAHGAASMHSNADHAARSALRVMERERCIFRGARMLNRYAAFRPR